MVLIPGPVVCTERIQRKGAPLNEKPDGQGRRKEYACFCRKRGRSFVYLCCYGEELMNLDDVDAILFFSLGSGPCCRMALLSYRARLRGKSPRRSFLPSAEGEEAVCGGRKGERIKKNEFSSKSPGVQRYRHLSPF